MNDPRKAASIGYRLALLAAATGAVAACDRVTQPAPNVPMQGTAGETSPGETQRDPGQPGGNPAVNMILTTNAFGDNAPIPARYTGDGDDVSPELSWSGVPEGAKELALIVDDPDAPTPRPWVHWVIYAIPAGATGLAESVPTAETLDEPAGAVQGKNSWGTIGYRGPAPPPGHGVHHYHFRLYALDAPLGADPGLDKDGLLAAMEGRILATAERIGTYQR